MPAVCGDGGVAMWYLLSTKESNRMINLGPGHRRHGRTPQTGEYSYISLVTTNTTQQYNQSLPNTN